VGETVRAMSREQRNAFLAAAARHGPDAYPAFADALRDLQAERRPPACPGTSPSIA
jgi:hypothetical protein